MWISNNCNDSKNIGYNLIKTNGELNLKRFKATFDYSLDLIKLREIYSKVYRNNRFSYIEDSSNGNDKEYCSRIVNVTFDYSVREWNRTGDNIYLRLGYTLDNVGWKGRIGYRNDDIIAIKTDVEFDPVAHADESLDNVYIKDFEALESV